ncbi:MAG: ABC transporter permease subunit [Verrucomicrobiales bacterium]|nr:ABC transporter permease subunit [Verrucomicrobiales bacterium]HQW27682.1 ABC transporter permease subunit [Verrucomicrobiales bacterium]
MSIEQTVPRAAGKAVPLFSLGRVWTIATSTVTQLVRMKTFYFLLAFALVVVAVGNFNIPATPVKELSMIKKVSFGTMDLFAWLFAIVATALLIPRDIEDRTLYTILSKPVRRIEYLFGKLTGVLVVVGTSLVAMYAICAIMIFARESLYLTAEHDAMTASGQYTGAEIQEQLDLIRQQGLRAELGIAVLASFFKASVVAAVTIFISTFASSSLFTIIVSILLFLIGHAHNMAANFWLDESGNSIFVQMLVKVIKILIPNYQLFSFSEGIVQGEAVVSALVWQMGGLTAGYLVVFLLLSLLVFVDKEF